MSTQAFPLTTYTDAEGQPLGGGFVQLRLNNDAQTPNGSICRGMTVRAPLDENGVLDPVPNVWPNASLTPAGTFYLVDAYTAEGQHALGPLEVTVIESF